MNSDTPWCPASGSVFATSVRKCARATVRDEHLAAVDPPDVAVTHRPCADRGDVGARVGLGDRDRADLRARDRRPQPAVTLVVGAELRERGRGHVRSAPRSPSGSRPRRSARAPRRTRGRPRDRRRCRRNARDSADRGSRARRTGGRGRRERIRPPPTRRRAAAPRSSTNRRTHPAARRVRAPKHWMAHHPPSTLPHAGRHVVDCAASMAKSLLERRLIDVSDRLKRLRAELARRRRAVRGASTAEAEDARLRSLVSETPLAAGRGARDAPPRRRPVPPAGHACVARSTSSNASRTHCSTAWPNELVDSVLDASDSERPDR